MGISVQRAFVLGNMPVIKVKIMQKRAYDKNIVIDPESELCAEFNRISGNLNAMVKGGNVSVLYIIFHLLNPSVGDQFFKVRQKIAVCLY